MEAPAGAQLLAGSYAVAGAVRMLLHNAQNLLGDAARGLGTPAAGLRYVARGT